MLNTRIATATLLALAGTAVAGPIAENHVPADAPWVAHFDVEALLASPMMAAIQNGDNFDIKDFTAEIKEQTGIDVDADLSGITVYGLDGFDDNAVVLLYGQGSPADIIELVEQEVPELQPSVVDGGLEYSWDDGDGAFMLRTVIGEIEDQEGAARAPWLIVASDQQELVQLAAAAARQPAQAGESAGYVELWVADLSGIAGDELKSVPFGAAMDQLESVYAVLADNAAGDGIGIHARMGFGDAEAANSMWQAGQGMLGLARFALAGEPQAQPVLPLLDELQFKVDGDDVTIDLSIPFAMLEEIKAAAEEQNAE